MLGNNWIRANQRKICPEPRQRVPTLSTLLSADESSKFCTRAAVRHAGAVLPRCYTWQDPLGAVTLPWDPAQPRTVPEGAQDSSGAAPEAVGSLLPRGAGSALRHPQAPCRVPGAHRGDSKNPRVSANPTWPP